MIIGIDLGTTNSAVAIMEAGQPRILEKLQQTIPTKVLQDPWFETTAQSTIKKHIAVKMV
jgi:molecular chaperone DnaK (HSP70)